jgi:HSP20 family protein
MLQTSPHGRILPTAAPHFFSDQIDLTVERNVLTVRAARTPDRSDGDEVIAGERRHGTFSRQLFLGDTLDASGLEASSDHGQPSLSEVTETTATEGDRAAS